MKESLEARTRALQLLAAKSRMNEVDVKDHQGAGVPHAAGVGGCHVGNEKFDVQWEMDKPNHARFRKKSMEYCST